MFVIKYNPKLIDQEILGDDAVVSCKVVGRINRSATRKRRASLTKWIKENPQVAPGVFAVIDESKGVIVTAKSVTKLIFAETGDVRKENATMAIPFPEEKLKEEEEKPLSPLDEKRRQAKAKRVFTGMSYGEIAKEMGVGKSTVIRWIKH